MHWGLNVQPGLDPLRMCFTSYSESSIVPVTFTPILVPSLATRVVCRSLGYVLDSSRIFSVWVALLAIFGIVIIASILFLFFFHD